MIENCVAFAGHTCVAWGPLPETAVQAKHLLDEDPTTTVLLLDSVTSEPIEVDFRGTVEDVLARLQKRASVESGAWSAAAPDADPTAPEDAANSAESEATRTLGRPRLGVVAREVTLLPRHWEWLGEQPGGASVTLRKLVEHARRSTADEGRVRRAREACYRFMNTLAGNEPGFEEALRALYAGDSVRFRALTEGWPKDVRDHARRLAEDSFISRS